MTRREHLADGSLKLVMLLLAGAGGLWLTAAPPEAPDVSFSTLIAAAVLWVVSLGIQVLTPLPLTTKVQWILVCAAIILLIVFVVFIRGYYQSFQELTFIYPPNSKTRYVKGKELAAPARNWLRDHPDAGEEQMIKEMGIENIDLIWTKASIDSSRQTLVFDYTFALSCLFSAVLCLTEFGYKKAMSKPRKLRKQGMESPRPQ